jgi:hypothetical protein
LWALAEVWAVTVAVVLLGPSVALVVGLVLAKIVTEIPGGLVGALVGLLIPNGMVVAVHQVKVIVATTAVDPLTTILILQIFTFLRGAAAALEVLPVPSKAGGTV